MSLDAMLPTFHFRERHTRATSAPAPALLAAAEALTWSDVSAMRVLMAIRSVGRLRVPPDRRILDVMSGLGFVVLERGPDEIVLGGIGRPWAPRSRSVPEVDAGGFRDFAEPGWAKIGFNFRVYEGRLSTETRVLLTDKASRRAFSRYWMIIRPFSGLIRRQWLAAVDRRARRA